MCLFNFKLWQLVIGKDLCVCQCMRGSFSRKGLGWGVGAERWYNVCQGARLFSAILLCEYISCIFFNQNMFFPSSVRKAQEVAIVLYPYSSLYRSSKQKHKTNFNSTGLITCESAVCRYFSSNFHEKYWANPMIFFFFFFC